MRKTETLRNFTETGEKLPLISRRLIATLQNYWKISQSTYNLNADYVRSQIVKLKKFANFLAIALAKIASRKKTDICSNRPT